MPKTSTAKTAAPKTTKKKTTQSKALAAKASKVKKLKPDQEVELLTKDMNNLAKHLGSNPTDVSSRRGLLKKATRRKALLRDISANSNAKAAKVLKKNPLISAPAPEPKALKTTKKPVKAVAKATEE